MAQPPRTVLITGCSTSGLGSALALAFHNAHYRVFATARNPAKMSHLTSIGIETLTLDVNLPDSVSTCVNIVAKRTGGTLDLLVNNAGIHYCMPMADIDLNKARQLFETNVWSYLAVTQAFLPLLLKNAGYNPATKRKDPISPLAAHLATCSPAVIFNTSICSMCPIPFMGVYNMSKAAGGMLADTMRIELLPFGIRVIELKTGTVKSKLMQNQANHAKSGTSDAWLPSNSIYSAAEKDVVDWMKGDSLPNNWVDADEWAKDLVHTMEGMLVPVDWMKPWTWRWSPPRKIWSGGGSLGYWLLNFIPPWMRDVGIWYVAPMGVVTKKLSGR